MVKNVHKEHVWVVQENTRQSSLEINSVLIYLCHFYHFLGNLNVSLVVLSNLSDDEAGMVPSNPSTGTQLKL